MNMKLKDMFKFAGDKKSKYPCIQCKNGQVYATNGRVCFINKMDYPEDYENTIRNRRLAESIEVTSFPPCDELILNKDVKEKISFDRDFLRRAIKLFDSTDAPSIFCKIQLKINDSVSVYIELDTAKLIDKYLDIYPEAQLYRLCKRRGNRLQFESYKKADTIFENVDTDNIESRFIFVLDNLNKNTDNIYTINDRISTTRFNYTNNHFDGLIERESSDEDDDGYIDIAYMRKYWEKYNLPDIKSFIDYQYNLDFLNIAKFDDYLHETYGAYDEGENALTIKEMFEKLFGDDANLMWSFFDL